MSDLYDLAIVGGGMAGASLALALRGAGLRLALIESAPLQVERLPGYDDRAIALALCSQRVFQGLGLWQRLAGRATPIRQIHVSERGGFGFTRLDAAEEGVPALGYVVTARDLGEVLLAELTAMADSGQLDLLSSQRVTTVRVDAGAAHLGIGTDTESQQLGARLLVAADGGNSFIRERLGFATERWDYQQTAVIANVTTSLPHQGRAFERFTGQGPLAMLPLTEGRSALVWTLPNERVAEVLGWDDATFMQAVQSRFGWRLGRHQQVGRRSSYPLTHVRAQQTAQGRVALIGNAAHSLHPIAGQGFNLGIRDVAALAEVVIEGWREQGDPGSDAVIRAYRAWREADQRQVAHATDGLNRLFHNPLMATRIGRNLGMLALQALPPVRSLFARHAMGIAGAQPRLGRGLPND